MPQINTEYPEGLRSAEMVLVRMLIDHRSWSDYREITNALWRIQYRAKTMQREQLEMGGGATEKPK